MKWKVKPKNVNPHWHQHMVLFPPTKTQDGYWVVFETIWRRWKENGSSGGYVYVIKNPLKDQDA